MRGEPRPRGLTVYTDSDSAGGCSEPAALGAGRFWASCFCGAHICFCKEESRGCQAWGRMTPPAQTHHGEGWQIVMRPRRN